MPSKHTLRANLGKAIPPRLNLPLKRTRHFCKTAILAFIWSLLSTPLTTLAILQLADQPGSPLKNLAVAMPYQSRLTLLAAVLIGTPLIAVILSMVAIRQVNTAWTPTAGTGYARCALAIAVASTLSAIAIFVAGTR